MKNPIFSIFDEKAEAFMRPFPMLNEATAVRDFTDAMTNPENPMARFPADYTLFQLGEFDDNTGDILPVKRAILNGVEARSRHAMPVDYRGDHAELDLPPRSKVSEAIGKELNDA